MNELAVVVLLIILIAAAAYELGRPKPPVPPPGPGPCQSPKMPHLGANIVCSTANVGQYARLVTADETQLGVGIPPGFKTLKSWTADDTDCVTENVCQANCIGDSDCSFYSYDASGQDATRNCPVSGSVCTTYSGPLPSAINAGQTKYVSAGIPASLLS